MEKKVLNAFKNYTFGLSKHNDQNPVKNGEKVRDWDRSVAEMNIIRWLIKSIVPSINWRKEWKRLIPIKKVNISRYTAVLNEGFSESTDATKIVQQSLRTMIQIMSQNNVNADWKGYGIFWMWGLFLKILVDWFPKIIETTESIEQRRVALVIQDFRELNFHIFWRGQCWKGNF